MRTSTPLHSECADGQISSMEHRTELYNGDTVDGTNTDTRKNELQHSQECYIEENVCTTNEVKVPNASNENICDKNLFSFLSFCFSQFHYFI